MRIGIIALLQESNTFLNDRTTLENFRSDVLLVGEPIREYFSTAHHEVGGFFAELSDQSIDAVPIFAARALPYGTIESESWKSLTEIMLNAVHQADPVDGLLVAPHGATVSELEPDADGSWLSMLRAKVGPDVPIIGTLDLHANLSKRMVDATDALIAYRTNPHIDQFECGRLAAKIMAHTLQGKIRPTQAAIFPPFVINIERQETRLSPCREIYQIADRQLQDPRVIANSILLGFPYADVEEMGCATLVVTNNDPLLAGTLAEELSGYLWSTRKEFQANLISAEEAIREACGLERPVCLLDMGDNVGGGSPADSTWIAHELNRFTGIRSLLCLFDPACVERCKSSPVGSQLKLEIGGHSSVSHGAPLYGDFKLLGLYDGHFEEEKPRHGGIKQFDQGLTAVVENDDNMTIVVTSKRMAPFSLGQITCCNLDPKEFDIIVAKGVVAPIAAYRTVCKHFIRVNTPGVTTADLSQLSYLHRRKPLYPFETNCDWKL